MNTDEMILELVATGKFTLPEGMYCQRQDDDSLRWGGGAIPVSWVHDLCAMHFARESRAASNENSWMAKGWLAMGLPISCGDSAAAIAALHGAVCAPA